MKPINDAIGPIPAIDVVLSEHGRIKAHNAALALGMYLSQPVDPKNPMAVGRRHICYYAIDPKYGMVVIPEDPNENADGVEYIAWFVTGEANTFQIHGWKRVKHCKQAAFAIDEHVWTVPVGSLRDHNDWQFRADTKGEGVKL